MQKVLRRTQLAKGQRRRKIRVLDAKLERRDRRSFKDQTAQRDRELLDARKDAMKQLREDWQLGPLAPWREAIGVEEMTIGRDKTAQQQVKNATWGTFSTGRLHPPQHPKSEWLDEHRLTIRAGDRVCVVEGPERVKGKIGKVETINLKTRTARVQGVNMIDVKAPSYAVQPGEDAVQTQEEPVPYNSLRLVYPMRMDSEQPPKDTILNSLVLRFAQPWEELSEDEERNAIDYQRDQAEIAFVERKPWPRLNPRKGPLYRYLMPQGIRIPWPTNIAIDRIDRAGDTVRTLVEERSFLPTLLRPPMPEGVIDELRNKYSILRVRHDDDWVEEKKREDEEVEAQKRLVAKLKGNSARNIARPPKRRGADVPAQDMRKRTWNVKPEVLELLGKHIAYKRGIMGPAKGVADGGRVPPPPTHPTAKDSLSL